MMEALATAVDDKSTTEQSSNFTFINVINQTISSIDLQWEYSAAIAMSSACHEYVFQIIKMKARDLWEKIYWGRKSQCTIKCLEQNVCYSLKILVLEQQDDEFVRIDESNIFKIAIGCQIPSQKTFDRAVKKSQLHLIKDLINRAPDLINLTSGSFTPLACATNNNDLNVVKLLLEHGADVNLGIPEMKRTPLHIAIFKGFTEENGMADLLIAHKANLRARDTLGLNIAHHAIDSNNLASVEYCLNKGIHTETRDDCGYTLLLRGIVTRANLDIIRLLLDRKAAQSVRDKNKMSVLFHVRMTNDCNLVELLQNYKPKSKFNTKRKLTQSVQRLMLSRKMQKDDGEMEDEETVPTSAFDKIYE
ncbi:unnamed protein product [Diamesa serratosioi]